jgi:chemotaxis protein MotB
MAYDHMDTEFTRPVKRGRVVLPWLLFVGTAGAAGYFYVTAHEPLRDDLRKKDATIADLTKQAGDAKEAQAELEKAKADAKQAKEDLARTAAEKGEDDKLLDRLKKEVGGGGAEVAGAGGQITVTMVDRILFRSGEADLTPQGEKVLRALGNVLANENKLIEVCGHADNQPVESELKQLYPSNWELSTARATNVVRFLQDDVGLKPRRLKASGFGSSRPIASNATANGRARNRRIEILLLPDKVKVVKGDFSEEMAAATPTKAAPKEPRMSDRDRVKAVAAARAKLASKKPAKK